MATASNNDIARGIYEVLKNSRGKEKEIFAKVAEYLYRHRLIGRAPAILALLQKIMNKDEGKITVSVAAAGKLKEKEKEQLAKNLSSHYGGLHVILEEKINPALLGGFRLEAEDEVIDLSLRGKLNKLQEHLTTAV